ncbi:MAG: phage tail protein [Prevotellaceae bacterium]|jgi:P2-related tail formation protein|nr:phage tail protein [Prevotellaceae bacterium]
MDNKHVIASSLTDNELAKALSELVAERWDNWDLSPFLAYLVDICAPAALPYLAEQFDIAGLQGFSVAVNEQQQRNLIKRSIALHKYIGTTWSIREACRTVGFPVIILEEGVPSAPENPTIDWARFRILIEADITRHITEEEARKLRTFVEFYKPARSHLVTLGFYQSFSDKLFRDEIIAHETLDVSTLVIIPNPVILSRGGAMKKALVMAGMAWIIDQTIYTWDDGSGDKITLEFTGAAGNGEIKVRSDPYNARDRAYSVAYSRAYGIPENRTKTIEIKTASGQLYGQLTVLQRSKWYNAYSRAYSSAYNTYPVLRVSPEAIWLQQDNPEEVQVQVKSNTDWIIE